MLCPTSFPRDVLYLYDSYLYNAQKIKTRGESLQNIGVTLTNCMIYEDTKIPELAF